MPASSSDEIAPAESFDRPVVAASERLAELLSGFKRSVYAGELEAAKAEIKALERARHDEAPRKPLRSAVLQEAFESMLDKLMDLAGFPRELADEQQQQEPAPEDRRPTAKW